MFIGILWGIQALWKRCRSPPESFQPLSEQSDHHPTTPVVLGTGNPTTATGRVSGRVATTTRTRTGSWSWSRLFTSTSSSPSLLHSAIGSSSTAGTGTAATASIISEERTARDHVELVTRRYMTNKITPIFFAEAYPYPYHFGYMNRGDNDSVT